MKRWQLGGRTFGLMVWCGAVAGPALERPGPGLPALSLCALCVSDEGHLQTL